MMRFILFFLGVILCGCSNAYKDHFVSEQQFGWKQPIALESTSLESTPNIYEYKDATNEKLFSYMEKGYYFLGDSYFHGNDSFDSDLRSFAKEIKAEVVLLNKSFTGVDQRLEAYTRDDFWGYSSYYDHKGRRILIPRYGPRTEYYYHTYNVYVHHATFWRQGKVQGAGVFLREMTVEERQKNGTNKGAVVLATVHGFPAFNADLLPEDVILKCNNVNVCEIENLAQILAQSGKFELEILRDGQSLKIVLEVK